jgi:hypothetical protein
LELAILTIKIPGSSNAFFELTEAVKVKSVQCTNKIGDPIKPASYPDNGDRRVYPFDGVRYHERYDISGPLCQKKQQAANVSVNGPLSCNYGSLPAG